MRGLVAACACVLAACSGNSSGAAGSAISIDAGGTLSASAEWGCLQDSPTPIDRQPHAITYTAPIVDAGNGMPIMNAVVMACAGAACDIPTPGVTATTIEGSLNVAAPFGAGAQDALFLRIEAPDYVPADYYFEGPLIGTLEGDYSMTGLPIRMIRRSSSLAPAPGLGGLALRPLNCLRSNGRGTEATDVQIEVTPQQQPPIVTSSLVVTNLTPAPYLVRAIAPMGIGYGDIILRTRADRLTMGEISIGHWGQ